VDDEAPLLRALCDTLKHEGYLTQGFTSGHEAIAALQEQSFDLLLTDLTMPELDGIALLRACREIDRELACVVMTGQGTIATAVDALQTGALDYVLKPFTVNSILPVLARALATRRLQLENIQLRESVSIYELSRAITQGLEHGEVVERTLAAAGQHGCVSRERPGPAPRRCKAPHCCSRDPASSGWLRRAGSSRRTQATAIRACSSRIRLTAG